jgi:predicted nucleotidyltransferase
MFGLSADTISKIQTVFKNFPEIEKAIIYGSRAKGNFRIGSDIDLTLLGEQLDLSILHKIENDLDDLLLPYKIDLSILIQIQNPELLNQINIYGIVFYDKRVQL